MDYGTSAYAVEYAKSGRSKCVTCKELIEKGALRFGSPVMFQEDSLSYKWRHWTCMTGRVAANVRGKVGRHSVEEALVGLSGLKPKDQAKVRALLAGEPLPESEGEEYASSSSSEEEEEEEAPPPPVKTPKKRAPAAKPKRAAAKRAKAAWAEEDYEGEPEEEEEEVPKPASKKRGGKKAAAAKA